MNKYCSSTCESIGSSDQDLYNPDIEQTVTIISKGEDFTLSTTDDLEVSLSSWPLAQEQKIETIRRIDKLQQVLQNYVFANPSSSLIGNLLGKAPPLSIEGEGSSAEAVDLAKPIAGNYFTEDVFQRKFRWNDFSGEFFSIGSIGKDKTTLATNPSPIEPCQ